MHSDSGYPVRVRTAMRRSQRQQSARFFAAAAAIFWLAARATPAFAQAAEAAPDFTFGVGECPNPKAVQHAILSLIPAERHELLRHGVRVELADMGESYRVTVWKQGTSVKKNYSDPAHECEGRARFAAVFAVLTLMPPELGLEDLVTPPEAPPPPPPKPAPRAPPPAPAPVPVAQGPLAHVELGFVYANAPAVLKAPSLQAVGGELRVALGRGALSGTLSVAYMRPAEFDLGGIQGEVARLPVSAGLRLTSSTDSMSIAGDLALLAVAQRVRATNLLTSDAHGSVEVGARAGLSVSHAIGPVVAPFVGVFAWLSPGPRELSALPEGRIGNLPYLWLGVSAGLSVGL